MAGTITQRVAQIEVAEKPRPSLFQKGASFVKQQLEEIAKSVREYNLSSVDTSATGGWENKCEILRSIRDGYPNVTPRIRDTSYNPQS